MQLTRLGPYKIDKQLGKGGMGAVYAATDLHTGQRVAIKALAPNLAMAEGFRERFESEIESLKTLRHDGIVRLFGYGEEDGMLFYSMELVDGVSLEDELKASRRFNWREVTAIAIQLSLALKHAHDHGIVHRDIKPANILLAGDEHVKLADFGIARLFGTTSLTTAGGVLGTADYMSPEQAEGRPVTARCDQYSLGGVMFALLAGRPPFLAKNLPQMLQLQRFANPEPVRRYAPDTPEQLERVIGQLLAKDPADRFPNMQVLGRHLQAMVIALTRPAADDFALVDHPADPPSDRPLESDITQVEGPASRVGSTTVPVSPSGILRGFGPHDAATLAAEEVEEKERVASKGRSAATLANVAAAGPVERPTRFTTVEEEHAREQAEQQRPWLLVAVQLATLAAVLCGMAAIAVYLSRPPSADQLYAKVADRGDGENEPLSSVEREIDTFLEKFPNDPRAVELQRYKDRIELDKLERKLRRQARDSGAADPDLLPAEQLYVRASDLAASSPDEAVDLLQSLIDLYGPAAPAGKNDLSDVVALARQRLKSLRADLAKVHERQLTALRERLEAADKLAKESPQQAKSMYQAIIDLYESKVWAAEIVSQARSRLEAAPKQ